MIYITGDTHGRFDRIFDFCKHYKTNIEDVMIILGDAGINYYRDKRDRKLKEALAKLPITLFCIHGNHEMRPEHIPEYKTITWNNGKVFTEEEYPNILFAQDGEIYDLNGKQTLVIGGAYSVDKYYRLERGWNWFFDEQPSDETKEKVEKVLEEHDWKVNTVLTHTVPLKYEPVEVFLPMIDQATVDKTTEEWLDKIEEKLSYDKWYAGHYHTEKTIDKLTLMFQSIEEFDGR